MNSNSRGFLSSAPQFAGGTERHKTPRGALRQNLYSFLKSYVKSELRHDTRTAQILTYPDIMISSVSCR